MKKISITLSNKLYNKINEIRHDLSKIENYNISFDEIIEESIMNHFNIKLIDINDDVEIIDNKLVNAINQSNNHNNYYIYVYFNERKKCNIKVSDYIFTSEPIYIGKGLNNRMFELSNRDNNLIDFIDELKSTNEFSSVKLINDLTKENAFYYEQMFISSIGRLNNGTGTLYNKNGGNLNILKKEIDSNNYELNIEYNLGKMILDSLNKTKNMSKTAKELNINLRTLYRKLDKYSIKKYGDNWVILK
jgi:hypothetical protein